VPFNGAGQFRFALVGPQGAILWTSGDVTLSVANGAYAAHLGDAAAGMPALAAATLHSSPAPALRVWFKEASQGWQQVGEDVSIGGAGPAAEGGITGAQANAILA